jgi:hypothetical protein
MADGAVHLDTTAYTLEEVVDQIVALVDAVEDASPDHSLRDNRTTPPTPGSST